MRRVQPSSEHSFPKFYCNIERGVHMTRQIRNFLHISCFPNFRGDLQGTSGPEAHIQGEGRWLHFATTFALLARRGRGWGEKRGQMRFLWVQGTKILAEGPGVEAQMQQTPAPLDFCFLRKGRATSRTFELYIFKAKTE